MIGPTIPENERERLQNLKDYHILDTLPEEDYDTITALASEICHTPISLVSLIDDKRQWFKSHHGVDASETPKEYAFCAHAINNSNELFIVPDSREDERFHDNPLVTGEPYVIFYTGVPLVSPQGYALGTLCVIDNKPNSLDEYQKNALRILGKQIITLLELRRNKFELELAKRNLEIKNKELERFALVAAHDIKSPLSSIMGLSSLLSDNYSDKLDSDGLEILELISKSSTTLFGLVSGILEHSMCNNILSQNKEDVDIIELFDNICSLIDSVKNHKFTYNIKDKNLYINKVALNQIFINLITNAIKYNDKPEIFIELGFEENENSYNFYVKDNGSGISSQKLERIFELFNVEATTDRFGNRGNGIGLATVKKLVEGLNGRIEVESEEKVGSTFTFELPK